MELKVGDRVRVKDTYPRTSLRGKEGTIVAVPCNIMPEHLCKVRFDTPIDLDCLTSREFYVLRKKAN